jgi:3-dehydroquinate synthase
MKEETIKFQNYKVIVTKGTFDKIGNHLENYLSSKIFIITDNKVNFIYRKKIEEAFQKFKFEIIVLESGEHSKSFATYHDILSILLDRNIHRDDLIISIGGGVVGDISGFVASTILRGVDFIQVPTTLLSIIDASIGGKNGVNFENSKNRIGTFYDPKLVFADLEFLNTLTIDEYINGVAEAIKIAFIGSPLLFNRLKKGKNLAKSDIEECIKLKKQFVSFDPKDHGKRKMLNFGHTFGHAIEKKSNFQIKHGIAVAYGMLMALELSIKLGLSDDKLYQELKQVLIDRHLVVEPIFSWRDYSNYIFDDKKVDKAGLDFIICKQVGRAEIIKLQRVDLK